MGGHLERCPCTATERLVWHSCKHRLCPRCAHKAKAVWLVHEFERLLPCAHHHLVFTLPHELLSLWRFNRRLMADLLFETAAATLTELLADPKYLGARTGLLLTLHTWSRAAALHPHVHALVTDGGLADGQWHSPRRSHFLPARVVKALFRGKFLSALGRRLTAGEVGLPTDHSPEFTRRLINRLGRVSWHVWLTRRYDHGEGVLLYLARYLHGGPLRDSQVLHADHERVVFRYQPNGASPATLSLRPEDWLQRYLEHVPVTGQHSLRRYGLYAPAARAACLLARTLVPPPASPRLPRRLASHPAPKPCCPHCAQPLHFVLRLPPQRSPP